MKQQGIVLITTMLFSVIFAGIALLAIEMSALTHKSSQQRLERTKLLAAAELGLRYAEKKLDSEPSDCWFFDEKIADYFFRPNDYFVQSSEVWVSPEKNCFIKHSDYKIQFVVERLISKKEETFFRVTVRSETAQAAQPFFLQAVYWRAKESKAIVRNSWMVL